MTHLRLALISLTIACLSSIAAAQEHPQSYTLSFPGYPTASVQLIEREGGLVVEVSDRHGHTYEARAQLSPGDGVLVLQSDPLRFIPRERKAGVSQALGGTSASTFPGAPRLGEGPLSRKRLFLKLREGRTAEIEAGLQDLRRDGRLESGTAAVDWSGEVERLEEAAARKGDLETQAQLERAQEHLERERAAEATSGDLGRVRTTTAELRDELAEIARASQAAATSAEAEALRNRAANVRGALTRAAKARDALELAELESKDPARIAALTRGLQARLAGLRRRLTALPTGSREAQVLRADETRTQGLLERALERREAAEIALVESKDPEQIDRAVTQVRTRLAELLDRTRSVDPRDPEQELLGADRARSSGLLGRALEEREAAEKAEVESKDPARIAAATARIRDRVAALEVEATQHAETDSASRLLRQERERSAGLLGYARQKREQAETKDLDSKRPATIQATTDRLQNRLFELEERLRRPTPASHLLREEANSTLGLLGYAGGRQVAADRLQIESKNLFLINQAGKRLGQRLKGLRRLERQARASGTLTQTWIMDRLLETEALYRQAQEARAALRSPR